jgi:hypothetical protein
VREHQEGAAQITAEESQPTRAGSALTGRPRDESRSTRQRLESLDSESPSREPKLTPGKRGGHLEENLEAEAARSIQGQCMMDHHPAPRPACRRSVWLCCADAAQYAIVHCVSSC